MLREMVRPDSDVLMIHIPKEYVDEELEVLVFKNSEVIRGRKEDLEEFETIFKERVKPELEYTIKMEDEVNNNDIF